MKRARPLVPRSMFGDYPAQLALLTRVLPNGCWEFTGWIHPHGYGQIGRNIRAHRLAWEIANGRPVPPGLVIDHQCHNLDVACEDNSECQHRRCVNPAHLEAVTQRINNVRGHGIAHAHSVKTHCDNGHEFTEANTYYRRDRFGRECRACRRDFMRKRNAEKRRLAQLDTLGGAA